MLETELSKKLRAFITSMDDHYGDGTCLELARLHKGHLYEYLNHYSKDGFKDYSIPDIYDVLIINELLCDDNENDMVRETKRLVGLKQSIERVHKELKHDEDFRTALVISFIKNAPRNYPARLEKADKRTISLIEKVLCREPQRQEQEQRRKEKGLRKDFKLHYGKNKRPSE